MWWWIGLALAQDPAMETAPADDAPVEEVVEEAPPAPQPDPLLGRVFTPTEAGQTSPSDPHWNFEVLYHQEKYGQCVSEGKAKWTADKDVVAAFHMARCQFHVMEAEARSMSRADRIAVYTEMLAMLEEAQRIAPDDTHLTFAIATANARMGTAKGVLASLGLATTIESGWKQTAESDFRYASIQGEEVLPCDAKYALGIFYRLVPDSGIVKLLAGTKGDLNKSIDYLTEANKCRPGTIRYLKELAAAEYCLGTKKKDEALMASASGHIQQLLSIKPHFEVERIDVQHGAMLQVNPKMACAYSRDGQQDLDEKKLDK